MELDKFVREIHKEKLHMKKSPSVVHCKAGIGRSCTFLSLYYVYKKLKGEANNSRNR